MSDRIRNGLLCAISLLVGGMLYVLLRENTILTKLVEQILPVACVRKNLPAWDFRFLQFYLPDLLWSFSLSCGLLTIFGTEHFAPYGAAGIAFALGGIWEILQRLGAVSGTGDVIDILMYLAGSTLCVLSNFKKEKKQ